MNIDGYVLQKFRLRPSAVESSMYLHTIYLASNSIQTSLSGLVGGQ